MLSTGLIRTVTHVKMGKYTTVLTNDHDGDLSQNSANSE